MSEMNKYQFFIKVGAEFKLETYYTNISTIDRIVVSPILEFSNVLFEGIHVSFKENGTGNTLISKVNAMYANITDDVTEVHCSGFPKYFGLISSLTPVKKELNELVKSYHCAFKHLLKGIHCGTGTGK